MPHDPSHNQPVPKEDVRIEGRSLLSAPTFYAQSVVVNTGTDDVELLFCNQVTTEQGQKAFVPRGVCYMTRGHAERFARLLLAELERTATDPAHGAEQVLP